MSWLCVAAELQNLSTLMEYAQEKAEEANFPAALGMKLELVIEEIAVNIVTHAYAAVDGANESDGDKNEMAIRCWTQDGRFCCTLKDWGPEYNPLEQESAAASGSIEEQAIGGLGVMLVKTMADACSYERRDNANELTFCFAAG